MRAILNNHMQIENPKSKTCAKRSRSIQNQDYVREQYKTPDNLEIRVRTHELYSQPKLDLMEWVLDQIQWQGHEFVVDVGCGSGKYVAPARRRCRHYVAADLSLGMLTQLESPIPDRINLNAEQIPLTNNSADVVLANHMLYHVPDQDAAVAEIARVLRPGGRLLAATNSKHNMAELRALRSAVIQQLTSDVKEPDRYYPAVSLAFTLEDGGQLLSRHFAQVERHDLPGALVFPEPQPVIDYIGTIRGRLQQLLPWGITWKDLEELLHQELSQHIGKKGEFRVNKLTGVFVCTKNQ
jgi:ubiquinone/menaquinone biosynthesis C-methylase UbiE